jgi:hypothetical protein
VTLRISAMGGWALSLLATAACSTAMSGTGANTGSSSGSSVTPGGSGSGATAASTGTGSPGAGSTQASGTTGASSSGSALAATGASGSTVASGGGSGATAAGATGSTAGASDEAGVSTTGSGDDASTGTTANGDTPAWRAINTDTTGWRQTTFTARQVDPTVSDPNSHPDDMERASVDTSKPLKKKLCVVLTGIGTGPGQGIGDWAGHQGFHVFQVGYSNAISMAANGDTDPDTPGNTRMNQFDAKGRTPSNAQTLLPDSIQERTIKAIQYLVIHDPGGDWGWFLNQDGTMRWSDGCFIGYSYGATHLAVIARYVRLGLGVSTSGPQSEGFPAATWIMTPSATPIERMFAIYGADDGPATPGHYDDTTLALGYIGDVLMTTTTAAPGTPPYMGSHRIEVDGQGHTEFCAGMPPSYCYYMFGLPPFPAIP